MPEQPQDYLQTSQYESQESAMDVQAVPYYNYGQSSSVHSSPTNLYESSSPELSLNILPNEPSQPEFTVDLQSLQYDSNLQPFYEPAVLPNVDSTSSSPLPAPNSPFSPTPSSSSPNAEEDDKPRNKKRTRRIRKDDKPVLTAVTLPRDKLLELSSDDLEDYVSKILAVRPLSQEEEKDIKRQRRLIKNRESAQMSRERKKHMVDDMRDKVSALQNENSRLATRVTELNAENKTLKEEVLQLQSVINKSSFLTQLLKNVTSIKSKSAQQSLSVISNKAKAAGICLMVVLFTFGMFFNQAAVNPAFEPATRFDIPSVIPPHAQSSFGGVAGSIPNLRGLLENIPQPNPHTRFAHREIYSDKHEQQMLPVQPLATELNVASELPVSSSPPTPSPSPFVAPSESTNDGKSGFSGAYLKSDLLPATRKLIQDEAQSESNTSHIVNEASVAFGAVEAKKADFDYSTLPIDNAPFPVKTKANTTYLLCNDVRLVDPYPAANDSMSTDEASSGSGAAPMDTNNTPLLLALLIPQGLQLHQQQQQQHRMLQVTCQILDINNNGPTWQTSE